MDWLQISQAIFLAAMLFFLFPRVKHALQNPEESAGKWGMVVIPLVIVIGIVAILIAMVR